MSFIYPDATEAPSATPTPENVRRPRVEKAIDINQLANENTNITIRNMLPTISVFVTRNGGDNEIIEFQPHGDADGGDFYEVPASYLRNTQFRKQINKEVYSVVNADNPDVLDAIEAQKSAFKNRNATKEANDALVLNQDHRSASTVNCIAREGGVQCPNVAVRGNVNEKPPLCPSHTGLANQYVPEETGKIVEGTDKAEVRWNRVSITRS